MRFQNWLIEGLKNETFGDTPEADFAADACADKKFRDFKKWDDLEMYLAFNGACREALLAAKKCWKKWEIENAKG